MSDLDLLKFLIMEAKYPYFSDDQLESFLALNNGKVYRTAAQLCLMKKDSEKSITVGPITIQNADPEYWEDLADQYGEIADSPDDSDGSGTSGHFRTYMTRADEV